MTCPFAHDDAAYVLGSLSPSERLEFERHLPGCPDCTRATSELAGVPGLLAKVDASVLRVPDADVPVPATLLPATNRAVRRARRLRAIAAAGLVAVAVLAIAVPVTVSQLGDGDAAGQAVPGPGSPSGSAVEREMTPVGHDVPVRARLSLERVDWGTRLGLTCTYAPRSVEYELPAAVRYTLHIRTRAGRTEQVSSWRSEVGRTMRLSAGTAERLDDIASVEVRTGDGRVVLRSSA